MVSINIRISGVCVGATFWGTGKELLIKAELKKKKR